VERLVERAMTYAVEEYDDDLAVARLAWLAHDDQAALDQACDVCLSYTTSTLASVAGRSGCWPGCCTLTCLPDRGHPAAVGAR
jgi:hypothetical protein